MLGLNYIVCNGRGIFEQIDTLTMQGKTDWFLAKFALFCKFGLEKLRKSRIAAMIQKLPISDKSNSMTAKRGWWQRGNEDVNINNCVRALSRSVVATSSRRFV